MAAVSNSDQDLQDAILYAVDHKLAHVISCSWVSTPEQFADPLLANSYENVMEIAAAKGIAVNFATGDGGDLGNGSPVGAPFVPADSPYVTAVGGTTILNDFNGQTTELGWGNVATFIGNGGPLDPPSQDGFIGGAGGGESVFFSKPRWQRALPGVGRQTPDVSALADPYTGVPIVLTVQGQQQVLMFGGTSLSCPIFSAFWVLANQAAGKRLGQAAPHIARAKEHQLIDIEPFTSATNPSGVILDAAGTTYYSPFELVSAGVELPTVDFVTVLWQLPATSPVQSVVLGFGMDTTLSVAKGWDNVTGFGVPNGLTFIQGFK